MGIIARHRDGIWVKVEAHSVSRFSIGRLVGHVDRIVVIEYCLQAIVASQGRSNRDAQIAAISCIG